MYKKNSLLFFIIFFFIIHIQSSSPQDSNKRLLTQTQIHFNNRFHEVRNKVVNVVNGGEVPSLSIAAAKDGKIIWEEAFGWADKEKKTKATPHTLYSLASVSKPFTATGLMVLLQKGLIDLENPVNDYFGEAKLTAYEGNAADATVKRVLNHTSGLTEHFNHFFEDEAYRCPSMEDTIRRYGILVTPPGEIGAYSNLGYGIIGYIISKVTGQSYAQFMKEEIFLPLGLTHTSVNKSKAFEKYAATLYNKRGFPIPSFTSDSPAAGAIYSSVHDLIRFGMFHLKNHLPDQKQILSDKNIQKMQSDWDPNALYRDDYYGLGWLVDEDWNGYRVVYHHGSGPRATSMLFLIPTEGLTVAVLCNSNSMLPFEICDEIVSLLLPRFAENLRKRTQEAGKGTVRRDLNIPVEFIGKWKGKIKTYDREIGVKMLIQEDGDFHIKLQDQLETLINNVSYSRFFIFGIFNGKIPTRDNERRPYVLQIFVILRDNRLSGRVTASALRDGYDAYNLSSWIELKKKN